MEHFIDRDPFEFINSTEGDLNGAIYDVLGKHLEQPAYRLMGEKVRARVKVAAWPRIRLVFNELMRMRRQERAG